MKWEGRRVYGAYRDDPDQGLQPGHEYVELAAGPLDGQLLDVTGISPQGRTEGAALIADDPPGMYGVGGRAWYGPQSGTDPDIWRWEGDTA